MNSQALLKLYDSGERNFREIDLVGADLAWAELENCDFANANLQHATLSNANLSQSKFCDADLSFATLNNVNFTDADLRGANLTGSNLTAANFTNAHFSVATKFPIEFHLSKFNKEQSASASATSQDITNLVNEITRLNHALEVSRQDITKLQAQVAELTKHITQPQVKSPQSTQIYQTPPAQAQPDKPWDNLMELYNANPKSVSQICHVIGVSETESSLYLHKADKTWDKLILEKMSYSCYWLVENDFGGGWVVPKDWYHPHSIKNKDDFLTFQRLFTYSGNIDSPLPFHLTKPAEVIATEQKGAWELVRPGQISFSPT